MVSENQMIKIRKEVTSYCLETDYLSEVVVKTMRDKYFILIYESMSFRSWRFKRSCGALGGALKRLGKSAKIVVEGFRGR